MCFPSVRVHQNLLCKAHCLSFLPSSMWKLILIKSCAKHRLQRKGMIVPLLSSSSNSLNIPILKICVDNMYSWKFGINKSIDDVTGVDNTNYQKWKINKSYDTSKNGLCHHKTVQTLSVEGLTQFIYKKSELVLVFLVL